LYLAFKSKPKSFVYRQFVKSNFFYFFYIFSLERKETKVQERILSADRQGYTAHSFILLRSAVVLLWLQR